MRRRPTNRFVIEDEPEQNYDATARPQALDVLDHHPDHHEQLDYEPLSERYPDEQFADGEGFYLEPESEFVDESGHFFVGDSARLQTAYARAAPLEPEVGPELRPPAAAPSDVVRAAMKGGPGLSRSERARRASAPLPEASGIDFAPPEREHTANPPKRHANRRATLAAAALALLGAGAVGSATLQGSAPSQRIVAATPPKHARAARATRRPLHRMLAAAAPRRHHFHHAAAQPAPAATPQVVSQPAPAPAPVAPAPVYRPTYSAPVERAPSRPAPAKQSGGEFVIGSR